MPPQYALVAYVKSELGRFVEELRHEIHPALEHLPAHLSILPPRLLQGSEQEALATLERLCASVAPFQVAMDGVDSFRPVSPVVFLRVDTAAPMRQLHDRVNTEALAGKEQWPYTPHLTIVKLANEERLPTVLELAHERWKSYRGSRRIQVEEVTFVRESERAGCWVDLATLPLGGSPAPGSLR